MTGQFSEVREFGGEMRIKNTKKNIFSSMLSVLFLKNWLFGEKSFKSNCTEVFFTPSKCGVLKAATL